MRRQRPVGARQAGGRVADSGPSGVSSANGKTSGPNAFIRAIRKDPRWKSSAMIPRITLFAVAALLLAAHFLRQGNLVMTALCALSPLLFVCRKRWSLIVLQVLAYVAAGVWIVTTVRLLQERAAL